VAPVAATRSGDVYILEGPVPEGEVWEFQPGMPVRCRMTHFQEEPEGRLVATEGALKWGDTVVVRLGARAEWRPGAAAEVVGMRTVETPGVAAAFEAPLGSQLLLVEFGDGSDAEVPERWLERA
jgi:hypothetical protein